MSFSYYLKWFTHVLHRFLLHYWCFKWVRKYLRRWFPMQTKALYFPRTCGRPSGWCWKSVAGEPPSLMSSYRHHRNRCGHRRHRHFTDTVMASVDGTLILFRDCRLRFIEHNAAITEVPLDVPLAVLSEFTDLSKYPAPDGQRSQKTRNPAEKLIGELKRHLCNNGENSQYYY